MQLRRAIRGAGKDVIERLGAKLGAFRVEEDTGRLLAGAAECGKDRYPIVFDGVELGAVWADGDGTDLAILIAHLFEREVAQRGLAAETLGRYKELSLIYDLGEALSNVSGVEEVARLVADEALTFLGASSAELLVVDPHRDGLVPLASTVQSSDWRSLEDSAPTVREVMATQRAQFAQFEHTSIMCAPLRNGERVFGVLVVTNDKPTEWTAGDLKLVTSMATKAADAVTRATQHRAQLRDQALRSQVDRFVSDALIEATAPLGEQVAVLYCDLGVITRSDEAPIDAQAAMDRLEAATALSLTLLLSVDATVNIGRGEMLVATFTAAEFEGAARAAVDAAEALGAALDSRNGGPSPQPIGVSVVAAPWADAQAFFSAVGIAATLHAKSEGRILLDAMVAEQVGARCSATTSDPETYELLP